MLGILQTGLAALILAIGAGPTPVLAEQTTVVQAILNAATVAHVDGIQAYHIAMCESRLRQFDKDGTVLRGDVNPLDTGIFQVNLKWHGETARRMGFNLFDTSGNIAYGIFLLHRDGPKHWEASRPCWDKENPGWE